RVCVSVILSQSWSNMTLNLAAHEAQLVIIPVQVNCGRPQASLLPGRVLMNQALGCRVFDLRLSPNSGARADIHSMSLSARKRSASGMVSPIAVAALRLMTSSNLVGN